MAEAIIALRGWHPAVSRAEVIAMFPDSSIKRTQGRRLLKIIGDADYSVTDFLSGTEAILTEGGIAEWHSLSSLVGEIDFTAKPNMKVECWRHGGKIANTSTQKISQTIGGLFNEVGATINLENPQHRFGVVLDAESGLVAWGWMNGDGPGSQGWSAMRANNRPFFKPISLEPRLARAVVNIAAGIGQNYVLDPMCGTGGLLIESALCNRPTVGIDVDPEMVEGAKKNIEWAGVDVEIQRADATTFQIGEEVSGVVLDPPYGRNSQGTLDHDVLLSRTLKNIRSQVKTGCRFVMIMPTSPELVDLDEEIKTDDFLELFEDSGWMIISRYCIPIHSSLARQLIIATAHND